MKILFCVEFYYPSVGGAQEVVRQIAERMAARGHDVTVATTLIATRNSAMHKGVRITGFNATGNQVRGIKGDVDEYQRFLIEQDADLVFFYAAQQWTFDAAWPVMAELRGKKVLIPCGYSGLFDRAYEQYFRDLAGVLPMMDAVVYHARSYRDYEFGQSLGLKNSVLIPNGADLLEFEVALDPTFRRQCGVDESAFVILTVGTITGLKGHLELVQAFAETDFGDRKALLILNGNRPEHSAKKLSAAARLMTLIRGYGWKYAFRHITKLALLALGLPINKNDSIEKWATAINQNKNGGKHVLLVDLPRERLIQAFRQADLFVFASNIEYSPLVLFEACAAGLPFLTAPVGNSAEIVEWTQGGELCEASVDERGFTRVEPGVLARRIEDMAKDQDKLVRLGRNGKEASQRRFNWHQLADEYESLFERLLETGSRETVCNKEKIH